MIEGLTSAKIGRPAHTPMFQGVVMVMANSAVISALAVAWSIYIYTGISKWNFEDVLHNTLFC